MTTSTLQHSQKAEILTDAFRLFNELSENLASSYQGLEEQVAKLNNELVAARSERLNTLSEKEKLASRLQQILAALPAGVVILNAFGKVIDCNNHALEFLGEPLLDQNWQTLMLQRLLPVSGSPRERQLQDGRRVGITRNLLSNHSEQIILLSDVSELRTLQDMLAQQKHLSAMGEMVASLAHQVRTPLATAVLYASQMSKPSLSEDKRLQFSQKILERLHYLERQVNDMLIYAKQGRLAMQSFSLQELLAQIVEHMESYPGCFSLQQELQHDVMLGNQDALLGALLNLLNNAIEVGAANISLTIQQGTDDNLLLVIRDDGPGMDAEEQRHVFEPFFTTKSHGTGLGLAVVDSVVKAHNGGIACRSSPGRGTVFTLILPSNNQYGLGLSAANDTQENSYEAI